jgi:sugar lactone lactonase YvrE
VNRELKSIVFLLIPACLAFCLFGCGPKHAREVIERPGIELMWPGPPASPRVRWVGEFKEWDTTVVKKGLWKRLKEALIGQEPRFIVKPYGIYVDGQDRLFIVDVGVRLIHFMDLKNRQYSVIPRDSSAVLYTPIDLTGDGQGNIYITDSEAKSILRYDLRREVMEQWVTEGLSRPTGIAYNSINRLIYVADSGVHQVITFGLDSREKFRFGSHGMGPGQFNYPTALAVDRAGQVVVTDALNARIQIFTPDGRQLLAFGQPGDTSGRFARPKGVAVDSDGHIYICDALFDAVQIFDQDGSLLLTFGESGHRPGEFWMPTGIFIDGQDRIYVADSFNQRVQVFQYLKVRGNTR